ncbi:GLUG domain protein [Anaerohalosphaera lusitana]|uniref:GLUG domain protein n=1 Tax=Anaerohalosphaera lusitana TaxID=1936003 RepID=A0A1U9NKV4_9BACT|nr:GLUG motif-containing protein [Anaerohalosphaera lusitana]AQT68445.1 GLUG domain protein [Anaerohalosphaera lusitana]
MNILKNTFTALLTAALTATTLAALPGTGTESDPWLIQTRAHFDEFAADPNYWDDHTRLETDIDLSDKTYNTAVIAPDIDTANHFQGTSFTGVFDGNAHSISNLTINSDEIDRDYLALFGCMEGEASAIKNIHLTGFTVTGLGHSVHWASLCSINENGQIINCHVTNSFVGLRLQNDATFGPNIVAGLCAENYGKILSCTATDITVSGFSYVGGLCAQNIGRIEFSHANCNTFSNSSAGGLCSGNLGTIKFSYANGTTNGGSAVGGLCAANTGTINKSFATGNALGTGNEVGGLCGGNFLGSISDCYATGEASGANSVGGLCGINFKASITRCYASGNPTGNENTGGLVGKNERGFIENCYSTGKVSGNINLGGLIGKNIFGGIKRSFWNLESSEIQTSAGGLAKTTAQMQIPSTFIDDGWVVNDLSSGTPGWYMPVNDYPKLVWQHADTAQVPYLTGKSISSAQNALMSAGFATGELVYVNSFTIPADKVTSLSVFTGGYVHTSVPIDIYVSAGSSADGSPSNPFEIACRTDLESVNQDLSAHYIMTNDVFMGFDKIYSEPVIAPDTDNGTEQFDGIPFNGSIDGRNHYISYFTISSDNPLMALIGAIGSEGEVTNVQLESFDVTGRGPIGGLCGINDGLIEAVSISADIYCTLDFAGGLAGKNNGTIYSSSAECEITGGESVGGICGINSGSLNNCWSEGICKGLVNVGGLCGFNTQSIDNSHSNSRILSFSDGGNIGGLCGRNDGRITRSYATGSIEAPSDIVGGLCGANLGILEKSFAAGSVIGNSFVGGLCGNNYADSIIVSCYASGSVTAHRFLGGLCGLNEGRTSNSYATGDVTGEQGSVGGLCGENRGGIVELCYAVGSVTTDDYYHACAVTGINIELEAVIRNCFWNTETAQTDTGYLTDSDWPGTIENVTGLTTTQMQTLATFTNAGWDFVGETANGTEDIWRMCTDGTAYPRLWWEFAAADITCPDGVNLSDLAALSNTWTLSPDQPNFNPRADFNNDSTIDIADLTILAENWLEDTG